MSGLNRVLLTVIGLLTLVVGLGVVAASVGLATSGLQALGLGRPGPSRTAPVAPGWGGWGGSTALVIVVVAALVLAVLAVLWLLGQLPSRHSTRPLRLNAQGLPGSVVVEPRALENVVEEQLLGRLGVTGARVEIRGAAAEPQVYVRLAAEERSDLPAIMAYVHTTVATDISTALQVPLDRFGLTLDLAGPRPSDAAVRFEAGTTAPAVGGR
ncbi:MAG: alkaline shock response membrane anchor protein AmaP [Propionibacteriaceae bacterium]